MGRDKASHYLPYTRRVYWMGRKREAWGGGHVGFKIKQSGFVWVYNRSTPSRCGIGERTAYHRKCPPVFALRHGVFHPNTLDPILYITSPPPQHTETSCSFPSSTLQEPIFMPTVKGICHWLILLTPFVLFSVCLLISCLRFMESLWYSGKNYVQYL